jgi:hypothetical protein
MIGAYVEVAPHVGYVIHCPKGHPYNGNNLYVDRIRRRYCQTCHRTRMAAYRAKLRERP